MTSAAPMALDDATEHVNVARDHVQAHDYRAAIRTIRKIPRSPGRGAVGRRDPCDELAVNALVEIGKDIFRDRELPRFSSFAYLREVLEELDVFRATAGPSDPAAMRLAGMYYTRLWFFCRRRADLEAAIDYYLRGFHPGERHESLKNGVSAAFCLDMLAGSELEGTHEEALVDALTPAICDLRARAREIRAQVVETLPDTVHIAAAAVNPSEALDELLVAGEALFGLDRFDEAGERFRAAAEIGSRAPDTDREMWRVARHLAYLVDADPRKAGPDLQAGFDLALRGIDDPDIVESVRRGSVGLALSGGGFRAVLFHVGVLARLAELGLLEKVEVLSCVSGGSIVGSQYYLELRRLLESTPDDDITTADYIAVVQRVAIAMLQAVSRNIRNRTVTHVVKNVRMALLDDYSPSRRLGELLEREVFSQAGGSRKEPHQLADLRIAPAQREGESSPEAGPEFRPKHHNWRRKHKVPILVLNATSLNTGHAWQFTTKYMGEPSDTIDSAIDSTERFRRTYLDAKGVTLTLGDAVAASAAVPGIFEPISLSRLYEDWTVRLVDGGVHDNQGVSALFELECDHVLVSDASGQIQSHRWPSEDLLSVPIRSNSILMQRIRGAQYSDLFTRTDAHQIESFLFVAMNAGLDTVSISPMQGAGESREEQASSDFSLEQFGIRREVQRLLAEIRTDLDSFSELEAAALMTEGYVVADWRAYDSPLLLKPARLNLEDLVQSQAERWPFLVVFPLLGASSDRTEERKDQVDRVLSAGRRRFFRLRRHMPALGVALNVSGALLLLFFLTSSLLGWPIAWNVPSLIIGLAVGAPLLLWIIERLQRRFGRPVEAHAGAVLWKIAFLVFGLVSWPLVWLQLVTADRASQRIGRLSKWTSVEPDWVERWRNRIAAGG